MKLERLSADQTDEGAEARQECLPSPIDRLDHARGWVVEINGQGDAYDQGKYCYAHDHEKHPLKEICVWECDRLLVVRGTRQGGPGLFRGILGLRVNLGLGRGDDNG